MKEKTNISKAEMQILMQERDDLEAKIKEEGLNIAKQTVEDRTGLVFDDKDPEWNEFVVKRFQIDSSMYKYTSLIERFVLFLFFIYFVLSGAFEFLDVGSGIPLIGEYLNPNSFSIYNHINIAKYFVIYLLLIQYVMPNVVSYFSLRNKFNISHVLYKHIRVLKWRDIMSFLGLSLMCGVVLFTKI